MSLIIDYSDVQNSFEDVVVAMEEDLDNGTAVLSQDEVENLNNDTHVISTTFKVYGSIFAGLFVLFCTLRWKFPKLYNLRSWVKTMKTELAKDRHGFLRWVWELRRIPDDTMQDECGMDALCFLRVIKFGMRLSYMGIFVSLFLIPIYITAEKSPETAWVEDTLQQISTSNLPAESGRFLATVAGAYMIFMYTMYLILKEFQWFTRYRHKFLSRMTPRNYSVYVAGIPEEYRSSAALTDYFRQCFSRQGVLEAHVAMDIPQLESKIATRDKLVEKIEHFINLETIKGVTPKHYSIRKLLKEGVLENQDSITVLEQEVQRLNHEIDAEINQIRGSNDRYRRFLSKAKATHQLDVSSLDADEPPPPPPQDSPPRGLRLRLFSIEEARRRRSSDDGEYDHGSLGSPAGSFPSSPRDSPPRKRRFSFENVLRRKSLGETDLDLSNGSPVSPTTSESVDEAVPVMDNQNHVRVNTGVFESDPAISVESDPVEAAECREDKGLLSAFKQEESDASSTDIDEPDKFVSPTETLYPSCEGLNTGILESDSGMSVESDPVETAECHGDAGLLSAFKQEENDAIPTEINEATKSYLPSETVDPSGETPANISGRVRLISDSDCIPDAALSGYDESAISEAEAETHVMEEGTMVVADRRKGSYRSNMSQRGSMFVKGMSSLQTDVTNVAKTLSSDVSSVAKKVIKEVNQEINVKGMADYGKAKMKKVKAQGVEKIVKATATGVENVKNIKAYILGDEGRPRDAGFVTFTKYSTAQAALQMVHSSTPFEMQTMEAPDPDDIFWKNVGMPHKAQQIGKLISLGLTLALCFFWTIPTSFISSLTETESLKKSIPALGDLIDEHPWVQTVMEQIAPLLLNAINALLPVILREIAKFEGLVASSALEASLFVKLSAFMIIQTFFVSALSGGISAQLENIVNQPNEVIDLLANSLPSQSTYFLQILLVSTFVGVPLELHRVIMLGMAAVRRLVGPNLTEKERSKSLWELRSLEDPWDFQHAEVLAQMILYFMVFFVYSTLAPITSYFLLFCWMILASAYRHQFIYNYPKVPDSGGKLWSGFIGISIACMLIAQLTIVGLLALKKATVATPLMFPLIAMTILFIFYIRMQHFYVTNHLPTRDCLALDRKVYEGIGLDHDMLRDQYLQPALKRRQVRPENWNQRKSNKTIKTATDESYDDLL